MTVSVERTRAAVLGHPVDHSLSPVLHRAAYHALGLDWTYDAVDVDGPTLPGFVQALGPEWVGLSLTMPLKEAVLPLLTDVDPLARQLRSVNTVVLTDARRVGYNTDVYGIVRSIESMRAGRPGTAVVLGAGATGRSAVAALAELAVPRVRVLARRDDAARGLVSLAAELGLTAEQAVWPPTPRELQADLVVSTVPAAAGPALRGAVPLRAAFLLDVLYDPWPTPLAAAWAAAGGAVVGGLEVLVHQAVEQVRLMAGVTVDPAVLRAAGLAELDRRKIAQAEQ
jgi:shikimate dehydrogenase